jgi:iron complex outermembrane receptor protein
MKKQLMCYSIAAALYTASGSAAMLEEVVVTAQKREQNLQDVGIAVSAFTGEQMAAMGGDPEYRHRRVHPGCAH